MLCQERTPVRNDRMTLSTFILKNAFRNKRRALLSVSSVAASLFLLVTLQVALRELTMPPASAGAELRVAVRNKISLTNPLPVRQRPIIEKIPGVESVSPFTWFGGKYKNEGGMTFAQFALDADKLQTVFGEAKMNLAGYEDYKEICEDARLEDRAHWELIVPRIYELGGHLPNDLKVFHDQAGCAAAKLPDPPTVVNILTLLLESERCAIRSWSAVCDITFGKDPRTYDLASRILNEEVEHEAWFIELLAHERDGKSIPSGHFRRGEPGDAPYSKNRPFYNP